MPRRLSRTTSTDVTEDDLISVPAEHGDGWSAPPNHDPLAKTARPRAPRARKDTKRWCKGVVGREHTLEIVPDPSMTYWGHPCGWRSWTWLRRRNTPSTQEWTWSCRHVEQCQKCHRKMRHGWDLAEDCPDFKPRPIVDESHPQE